jgi:DNA polymerase-3 subunit beta
VEAECDAEFTFVLNAKLFSEMARRMSGDEITLEIEENLNASLISENTKYQLSAMSAEEFPALPVVESMAKTVVSQQVLRSMIQESSFAASVKEDKPILTGELFESSKGIFYIVAMDRFRLALRQEKIQDMEDFHFVVPKKALSELISMMKSRLVPQRTSWS